MLSLFTVFHANLDFSSVPPGDVGRVLDRCLWPLVEATREPGVRLGLELTGDTLARVAREDVLLLDALRAAIAGGRLEIVGSGLAQVILPLVPAAVGAHNLQRGQDVYRQLLGVTPRIAYLHEQTYAAGLVVLYREAGYEALVAEWENPASAHGWPEAERYRAAWVEGTSRARIACLWNSSVLFQRVQRYAHGEIEVDDVLALLATHHDPEAPRALCLYGNDCEVFDYRPGSAALAYGSGPTGEWARLGALFRTLLADGRFAFVTPSEALARHPPVGPPVHLESAAMPLPAKKQAKYNASRWAVCGRDNVRLNTRCHALHRRLELIESLQRAGGGALAVPEGRLAAVADELVRLWGSDLRTHTTEERAHDGARRLGAVEATLDALLAPLEHRIAPTPVADEVVVFNPHPVTWAGWPLAVRVHLPPGLAPDGVTVEGVATQLEEVERHRDGSIRRALLVATPVIPAYGVSRLRLRPGRSLATGGRVAGDRIETASTAVRLALRRGATLRALSFPRLADVPLAGTLPQGTFAPIELAADWYTGHVVLLDGAGTKLTDLEPVEPVALAAPEDCPIRIPLAFGLRGTYGELWKTVYVYREHARADVRYHFALRDARPRSLRLGVLTLDPAAFRPARLCYATLNGGRDVETFPLAGARVQQHEPVNLAVSARGCLGATEGWVDVGDDDKGITVAFDQAALAATPLVQHEPAGERALTRVFLSLAESDDTAAPFFRGHTTCAVSYLGRGADMTAARRHATAVARGLHVLALGAAAPTWPADRRHILEESR